MDDGRSFISGSGRVMRRWLGGVGVLALMLAGVLGSANLNAAPGTPPVSAKNMRSVAQLLNPNAAGGTDSEFLERDGRTYIFAASLGEGFSIYDITDVPTGKEPGLVGRFVSPGYQNDIQVQGNLAVLATDEASTRGVFDPFKPPCPASKCPFEGVELVDVSNLSSPKRVAFVGIQGGAHTVTLLDNTLYVSNVGGRTMDVIDVSKALDPNVPAGERAKVILRVAEEEKCASLPKPPPFPCQVIAPGPGGEAGVGWDPHDLFAQRHPGGGHRLFVAAIDSTYIVDVPDPSTGRVEVVSKIVNVEPGLKVENYSTLDITHQADPSPDGKLLAVTDERGGGLTDMKCPAGGIHMYNIEGDNIRNPVKLGVYFAPDITRRGNCTSHVLRWLPDRNVMTLGWYTLGTWVVDMTNTNGVDDFNNPAVTGGKTTYGKTLGHIIMPGANTWATKSPGIRNGKFFMYATDLGRGSLDVFEFTAMDQLPPPMEQPPVTTTPVGPTSTGLPTATSSPTSATTSTPQSSVTATIEVPGEEITPTVLNPTSTTTGGQQQRKLYLPFVIR